MSEIWKPVVGYEGFYEVSSRGRVRSVEKVVTRSNGRPYSRREKILRPATNPVTGYLHVMLQGLGRRDSQNIHSLVMEAFVGPRPDGLQVRHLNGKKTDNRWPDNLAYGTRGENMQDAIRHGTFCCGEKSDRAVLTEEEVLAIRDTLRLWPKGSGKTGLISYLAAKFGVSEVSIRKVRDWKTWRHV